MKLPPIQLSTFSGDYRDWLSFRDVFKSLVHDNTSLSNVNKCQYLKSSLRGEAENLVKQIAVSEVNYEIMWEMLNNRYNNKRCIVNTYIGKLFNLKRIQTESAKNIREILDVTTECLAVLKSIGLPTESWDDIVVYTIIQKLDIESHRMFEQRLESNDKLPTWNDLSQFLEFRFRTLEAVKSKDHAHPRVVPPTKSFATEIKSQYKMVCGYCKEENHYIYNCKEFCKLDLSQRKQFVQTNQMCFNCLRKGHDVKTCLQSTSCRKCGRRHHSLLHGFVTNTVNPQEPESVSTHNAQLKSSHINNGINTKNTVILTTALIQIQSQRDGSYHTLRALIDQGSQASLITESARQFLGLKRTPIEGTVTGVGSATSITKATVDFNILSRGNKQLPVRAYVLKTLTSYIPQYPHSVDWPQLKELDLADPTFQRPGKIDIILGADVFAEIIREGVKTLKNNNNTLVAQETSLGWLISGCHMNTANNLSRRVHTHHVKLEVDTMLQRFWELEETSEKRIMTKAEIQCESHYDKTHVRLEDGSYQVRMPFKTNPPDIGESLTIAEKRFHLLENKFKRNQDLHERYTEFMNDYIQQNHMEPVSTENTENKTCYIPHQAVINDQHLTTKLRVVFDSSAKTTNGKSLNDNLLIGPPLQNEIRDVTLRWRRHRVVLIGDIRQMYRRIHLDERDRDYLRILWRASPEQELQQFRLTTVTYGTSCAPYLAIKTLRQLAEDERGNFEDHIIDTVLMDFYIDDLLTGAYTVEMVKDLKHKLIELLQKGGFTLHKWASNSTAIEDTEQTNRKILGINWNGNTDKFELKIELPPATTEITKRTVLGDIAKIYDPAGWLAPVVIVAKGILQKLWIHKLQWDDYLPPLLHQEWLTFRNQLINMPTIELDRWIGFSDSNVKVELHGFSDASTIAYSAVVYCRVITSTGITVTMIEAKTRVAPVKQVSLPRLELCGAVLLAKLLHRIRLALSIPLQNTYAWTDAKIVLAWLQKSPSCWTTFVANRATEIINLIDKDRWFHVPSIDNPADVASRGIAPVDLPEHHLWWHGPSWLRADSVLPLESASCVEPTNLEEKVSVKVNIVSQISDKCDTSANLCSKDEWVRLSAQEALRRLARRCGQRAAARAALAHAFAEYHGAGGKRASSEDKIALLNGVAILSSLNVSAEDRAALFAEVLAQTARVLEGESHERTLLGALHALRAWLPALDATLPDKLLDVFKKNLSAKNTTQTVRIAYMSLVAAGVRACGVSQPQRDGLLPALAQAVERAAQQPLQHLVVCEGIAAMLALVLLDTARTLPGASTWAALAHASKHVLLHERALAAAPDDVLIQVVLLCRTVLEKYSVVAEEKDSPVYRAFILVLLSPIKSVRDAALEQARSLLANQERALLARYLVLKLNEILEEGKIFVSKEKSPPEEKGTDVTGKMILDCVQALCSYKDYSKEDTESLALDILPSCHHPLVVAISKRAWQKVCVYLRLDPEVLVDTHSKKLINLYVTGYTPTETMSNLVTTLVRTNAEAIAGDALQVALDALVDPELLRVTRVEYFTYLTPDGELYDKSSVPGNDDNKEMNLKRESKAYSYKEQLEELQLRRELEEKMRKQGKTKEAPLTAKQKEAIKAQLAKESVIRQKLSALNARVVVAAELLEAVRAGSALALAARARLLVWALIGALRSPLAAPRLLSALCALRPALLPRHTVVGDTVARFTIRLHNPQCDLDPSWEEEDLDKGTIRAINLVHSVTAGVKVSDDEDAPPPENYFTAPGFCYVFPLLKQGLTRTATRADEAAMISGLGVIAHHAALRESADPMLRPELFPIDHMFRLLIDLISNSTGRVQTACTVALLETARCAARGGLTTDDVSCLLAGLQNPLDVVRDAALRALMCVQDRLPGMLADEAYALPLTKRLLIATFDVAPDNKKLAEELWERLPLAQQWSQEPELVELVLDDVTHPAEPVQRAAALALAHLVERDPDPAAGDLVLQKLMDLYKEKLPLIPAKLDQFGHVVEAAVDEWGARRGAGVALGALAPRLTAHAAPAAITFFVHDALGDRHEAVRAVMLDAAMAVVDLYGKETVSSQLPVFENFLDKAPKSGHYDCVRQSVVLLMGSLARHLSPNDERVRPITLRLIAALSTPSQQVQEAVSNCLPHLVNSKALQHEINGIMARLVKQLLTAEKYGDRKGAAYGIAGLIKGLGILSLKSMDVMGKLTDAVQEKKNYRYREGALFGFEMLCHKLGRLFEPYVVHVLPHLLNCFGDTSQYVRAAADDTAKLIMSRLSAHGVKLVLPALLEALNDDNWRTKAGSIELLGAMAYCAPKQLSSCLPSIVPKLIEVLSDSHMRVQEAGVEALGVIGSVIRNPEIQAIVPVLLQALQDPSNKTSACLQTLLDTKFVHFIDAPSLALIMPVVQRAFLDRSTETRKMAAQIIGNMYSLTDQKDLMPYLPSIIPGLKSSLLDPVPEVRSVSARALGAMVRGMGEQSFEELLPWLMSTLTSESSSVDRSGAAQGLSEVVAGLGVHKLHTIMPDIIATAERTDIAPHVKDGYIMMFIYMPGAFTDEFTPYIGQIINPILKALADENEYVRETALKAGQRIVTLYAESAITLLLPELERGLFDDNWRIRYSSVQLLGDLLYRISGVSGKMSTETASEDDNFGTEHSHKAIMRALGPERRNRVLAGLYMGRSDVALMVRQAALHVWKVVVTNTPKTLREILPTLFSLLLGCLASTSYDKRQVAARTLGDLVRKLGERVLPEIVPILERGLKSERADQRQGVCIGLGEILASTSREAVMSFADGLVPTVRTALCDPLPEVRLAAARAFDSLHATIGNKALDDILPHMLRSLHDPDKQLADATLDGLKQVMAIKSRAVLPYLVPVLTGSGSGPGGNAVDTRALSALAAAAGGALGRHLPRVLPALLTALVAARGRPDEARELENCRDALLPVTDAAGVRSIIDTLLETIRTSEEPRRRAAAALLCAFVAHTRAELAPHVAALLRGLLALYGDKERELLCMAYEAMAALTRTLDAERMIQHVPDVRTALRLAAADLKGDLLPGFCMPKGISPLLPLFRESILNGLPEDKENAALMLGEIIKLTSAAAIQPSVVHITGPLIRILGDRFNSSVKAAVLETLASLLSKVGSMLKQFLPQLQTTFLKALHDGARGVRIKAGQALAQLVLIHTRADPLFVELHNGVRLDDPAVRDTMLQALRGALVGGGDKMSEPLALAVLTTLSGPALLAHPDDPPRQAVGGCLGALLPRLPPAHRDAALLHHVLAAQQQPHHHHHQPAQDDWLLTHGRSAALFVALKESPAEIYRDHFEEKIEKTLLSYLASERVPTACNGLRGAAYLLRHLLAARRPAPPALLQQFVRSMNHQSNEVKQLMATAGALVGRAAAAEWCGETPDAADQQEPRAGWEGGADVLRALLPALVNGTKEKNTYVRANSELALKAVLRLPADDAFHQKCVSLLDEGAREALADVVARVLRRAHSEHARDEELDCTLLT